VHDPVIRPACVFFAEADGRHTLDGGRYRLIPPGGSARVEFPTDRVRATPAIIRVLQRVSTVCEPVKSPGDPITCHAHEVVTTDPVAIFEPGTSEAVEYGRGAAR